MTLTLTHVLSTLALALALTFAPTEGQNYREGLSSEWGVYDYPNPHSINLRQQRMCGRFNQSYICDPNAVITTTEADHIDAEILRAMSSTPCHCLQCQSRTYDRGYKFRVAIMNQLVRVRYTDEDRISQLRDARLYAYILSQRWQMEGFCNESVLILFSRADNLVYTLTMPTAKLRLSNDDVTRIIMITRPYFENRETIADGIIQMIRRYSLVFKNKYNEAFEEGAKE